MPQDSAKMKDLPEQSPVAQARAKLGLALEQLESIVLARLDEAAMIAAQAQEHLQAAPQVGDDAEQWKNACRMLEEQLASLREENSQLHDELHQKRSELSEAHSRAAKLEKARAEALGALDSAIAQVEGLLKG